MLFALYAFDTTPKNKFQKFMMEEKFNSIAMKLPIGKDEDVWTYELFSGLSEAQMEDLIKELPRQIQSRYRNIFNENRPNKASKGYFSFTLFKIFFFA
jgi:hypothetical protein